MRACSDLDVKALLQRLGPAQRHTETGVALASCDRLQKLVGRAAVVDELDVEILLLEKAIVDCDWQWGEAHCPCIPGQFQLARQAGQRRRIGRGSAERKLRAIDR